MIAFKIFEFRPNEVGLKDYMGNPIYVKFTDNGNYGILFYEPRIKDKERNVFVLFRPDGKLIKVVKAKDPENPPVFADYCCGRFVIRAKDVVSVYILSEEGKKIVAGSIPAKYAGRPFPLKNGLVSCRENVCGVFDDELNLVYEVSFEKKLNYRSTAVPFVIDDYIAVIYQLDFFLIKDGKIVATEPINAWPDYVEVCKNRLLVQQNQTVKLYDITNPEDPYPLYEVNYITDDEAKHISFVQDCRHFLVSSSRNIYVFSDESEDELSIIRVDDTVLGISSFWNYVVFGTLNKKIELYEIPFFTISCYH